MTSEMETAVGRRGKSLHPLLLIEETADTLKVFDELTVQLSQARGLVGLLTQFDHEDLVEAPNCALAQTAWTIDEQLERVHTLAQMLLEHTRTKASLTAD